MHKKSPLLCMSYALSVKKLYVPYRKVYYAFVYSLEKDLLKSMN